MSEPTTSEYLNAANWTYTRSATMPADLRPLLINGQQLTMQVTSDGFYGAAFVSPSDQVVIAYEGTSPSSLVDNTPFGLAQLSADLSIYFGQNIGAYGDAANFAQQVLAAAAQQGITASNVFVAGHSMGGAEAQYVAAQLGLSGETFGAPGIPATDVTPDPGQVVDYVESGDPVGNYASQPPIEGRFIYSSGIVHVGTVDYLGSGWEAIPLGLAGILFGTGDVATTTALGLLATNAAAFHLPPVYATDLDVVLTNPDLLGTGVTVAAQVLSEQGTAGTLDGNGGGPALYLGSSGNDAIATVTDGVGVVAPGSGDDRITANGSDVVLPGTGGSDTIFAVGHVLASVGAGVLTFVNGANAATVLGGAGSALIAGGAGGGLFAAGAGGDSTILAGAGAATIFGGGNGDALFAGGTAGDEIVAGQGNETLSGFASTGNDVLFDGSGDDLISAGSGNDTIFAGSGNATMLGGAGADLFAFVNGRTGGTDIIAGFNAGQGDRITLQGYGAGAAAIVLGAASVSGGSESLSLADGTTIELLGVTNLSAASLA